MSDALGTDARKVLVVEDEYVVARDLAETLERRGLEVVGPVATPDAAMSLILRHGDLSGAVLDINLGGKMAYPLAEVLARRGVPFVFATGYDRKSVPPAWRGAVRCEKPLDPDQVVTALDGVMRERRAAAERSPAA